MVRAVGCAGSRSSPAISGFSASVLTRSAVGRSPATATSCLAARRPIGRVMGTATATRHYASVNPYTGETVKEFDTLTRDEVDRAVAAAHDAFLAWRERPIAERAAIVRRAGELMLERADALARLVTLEMGKLIAESREEAGLSASILRYYGDEGPGIAAPRPLATEGAD